MALGGGRMDPTDTPLAASGEVYDRGYRHYEGLRLGRRHAVWALAVYSMQRALGIKKGVGAKIIPILLYLGVALPVVVSIGIRAVLPAANVLDYAEFFVFVFLIEGIYVATIAPELLCGDRREHVLTLYFTRPITRADYLLAKLVAAALLTLTVSFLPAVVLWVGRQLLLDDPLAAMRDHAADLGRIALAGPAIAFYLGAGGLMIASFTGRKSVAVAVIVAATLTSQALAVALFHALDVRYWRYVDVISPANTVADFVGGLFGVTGRDLVTPGAFPAWVYAAEMGAAVLLCCAVIAVRYVPRE